MWEQELLYTYLNFEDESFRSPMQTFSNKTITFFIRLLNNVRSIAPYRVVILLQISVPNDNLWVFQQHQNINEIASILI